MRLCYFARNELFQRYFSRILTENFPWQLSQQLFIRTSFFQGHLCGCFRTLFTSTRLLFYIVFLISPICCFVMFTPVIKFNSCNGWFEHCIEVLGIWDKVWCLTKRSFCFVIDKSNWDTTHVTTEITFAS